MGGKTQVVGIGTVDLPTKTDPTKTGPRAHGILRLKNVLHAPGLLCNIIGKPIADDYRIQDISSRPDQSGFIINRSNGRSAAYFKPLDRFKFFEVRLSGPPIGPKVGPSPLSQQGIMLIHAFWPNSEREKFIALQAAKAAATDGLTDVEKAWLKEHGGEYRFLKNHGLSIYKEEDREEGRITLRAVMSDSDVSDRDTPTAAFCSPIMNGFVMMARPGNLSNGA
ncbi:hypothetical protein QQX98_008659 [Neonectria punicea]|uniref:Uncharacterized protein n=1 Tax=Neonectria punicea TaxID=979145 RepID=A0ABR1GUX8_9HYPO